MKAGDKVVCVYDGVLPWSHEFHHPNGRPIRDEVYCVERYFPPYSWCEGGKLDGRFGGALRIVGKPLIHTATGTVWVYRACDFRPFSEVGHPPIEVEQPLEVVAHD